MQINAFRYFSYNLLQWNSIFYRNMPWRGEKNPYKVWLSEIILQQTRVEQGLPYYLKFVERYPNIESLANAPQQEILKNWEGLGYYSRAKNMHFAANKF
jgi:A/G-specific adenine glycosylase